MTQNQASNRILPALRGRTLLAAALCAVAAGCSLQPNDSGAFREFGYLGGRRDAAPASEASYVTLMRVGEATRAAGDLAGAVTVYRRAADKAPGETAPLIMLGTTLTDLKAFNEAGAAFRAALKLAPNDSDALRGLGNTLVSLDQPQLAAAQFEAAMVAKPDDPRVYNSLGVVLDMSGDHRAAQAHYRQGLTIAPGNLSLQNNLGLSLALSGNYSESIEVLRALALHPAATARNRQNLALVYGLAGQNDAAARISRLDLDEVAVKNNVAYYGVLRALNNPQRRAAIGSSPGRVEVTPVERALLP